VLTVKCRMDKFLYLVRQTLLSSFRHFAKQSWKDTQTLDEYLHVLATTPLNPKELRIPNGLRYHMIDIYVDELEKVEDEEESWPVDKLLAPLQALGKESPTKSIRERVKVALDDERVRVWLGEEVAAQEEGGDEAEDKDEWGGIQD
jgi:ribosomal RNA-processing protein 1